ncbi:MAG: tyrosine--tRNA ligase [Actinobacteria bacterium]|nr:tyrosine--tRNA ligase [Actinomycetota bacterium]
MRPEDATSAQLGRLTARCEHVEVAEDLRARLVLDRPLRVKLGVDPTASDITLGWAVPLRKLRRFQDEGHVAVLILGDFTARIGDPSGKSETRPQLAPEQVRANADACVAQLLGILSENNLEVRYNSEWLESLNLTDVLRLTSRYTVARMLERDDFSKRYALNRPISISEFMYPLLQGYDSIAIEADVELGGTDQLFNLLVGRDLQRAYGQSPQVAMTMPLLVGLDGTQKMSQSLGNYVGIEEAPDEMFGKLMSIPDRLIAQYATLAAELDSRTAGDLEADAAAGGPKAGAAKRTVARAVVALYHGDEAAGRAEVAFDRQFKLGRAPEDVTVADIPGDAIDGNRVFLPRVLAELGLASSRTEARRLISGGGVKVDGEPVGGDELALADLSGALLQVGKRRFVRLR